MSIWIIEYDREFQSAAATRLPVPVISAHALLAVGGLELWILYLIVDETRVVWAAVAVLALLRRPASSWRRWIPVHCVFAAPGTPLARINIIPPERNFPLPVVVAHGILGVTTLVLVLFTALGAGPT